MSVDQLVQLIAACGGGILLPTIVKAIQKQWTGRSARERSRVDELVQARDCAEVDRDHQAKWRRILQEYVSLLRSMLIERGVQPSDIPSVPSEPAKKRRDD